MITISSSEQTVIDLLIKQCEGIRLKAYKDQHDIWTIGIGLARTYPDGTTINEGDVCTEKQAYTWLNTHLYKNVYPAVYSLCSRHIVPKEVYESLCCFVYNVGESVLKENSIIIPLVNSNWQALAQSMRQYNKVRINGVLTFSQGLANRREIEINNFKHLFEQAA